MYELINYKKFNWYFNYIQRSRKIVIKIQCKNVDKKTKMLTSTSKKSAILAKVINYCCAIKCNNKVMFKECSCKVRSEYL